MRKVIIDDLPYKKISLGVCTECNTEKFHCINDDGSIDFLTVMIKGIVIMMKTIILYLILFAIAK